MKNCLIMGFGRSGTSLMGEILHNAGYYMGEDLYPPRHSNPHGFFENAFINRINERILENYDYATINTSYPKFEKQFSPYKPGYGHRWLSYIPSEVKKNNVDHSIRHDIQKALSVPCFAYKDPRFNYTLPIWDPFLKNDVMFICMFRHPSIVVESVIKECNTTDYLSDFYIDRSMIYNLWLFSYTHLLKSLNDGLMDRFIFLHYEQLMNRKALPELTRILGIEIDPSFASSDLNRSHPASQAPKEIEEMYKKLCSLSGFEDYD